MTVRPPREPKPEYKRR